jgi:phosphate transport system ATP-binding protein
MNGLTIRTPNASRNGFATAENFSSLPHPPVRDAQAIFALSNVSVAYGDRIVLEEIAGAISERQVTAIIGPSGCGKSTLLRLLNRTLELIPRARLVSGVVRFRDDDLYGSGIPPSTIRRQVGLIHQRPVPFPMPILDDVLFGARYHGLLDGRAPLDYARDYLEQVGLWKEIKDRLDDRAERLSGGQQQRLCLARTLANQPQVILMDEPCSSLDPAATKQIEELVFSLKERYTIIIVTHNLAQAKRVCDQAIFIFDGKIVESGSREQLFQHPHVQLTRDFISGELG